jgi:hypothetical protein
MRKHLLKIVFACIGGWVVALGLAFILPVSLGTVFIHLISLLIGLVLFILALVALVIEKRKFSAILAIVLVLVVAGLALTKGVEWGAWVHFRINRGSYEARLARILAVSGWEERRALCGRDCLVLRGGNSDRVAFPYMSGFIFDYYKIVYDPTGGVMEQDYDRRTQIDQQLIRAKHLSGDWYLAFFSD